MVKGIIRLGFQKIIDEGSTSLWDKYVFDDTWMEFKMQAANYNQQSKATLFTNILHQNPATKRIHASVSMAAIGYIQQLNEIIPGLEDMHGKTLIPFKNFKFSILQSDMADSKQHKVELIFISEPLTLIDVFNNSYLIAPGDRQMELNEGKEVETILLPSVTGLSIHSFINPSL
ncbi:hypothetical protein [Ferruginibacter sp.]